MQYIALIMAAALLLAGCSSPEVKETISQKPDSTALSINTIDTIPFAGSWVNEAYYSSILSSKSPRAAQGDAQYVVIPSHYQDSTLVVYGFHEAGGYFKIVKNGNQYLRVAVTDKEFAGKMQPIKIVNSLTITIGDETFIKISDSKIPEHKITELLLFHGKYTYNNQEVVLGKSGEVTGLEDFKYYEIYLDYQDQGMNVDLMLLGKSKEDSKEYTFQFNKDTLSVYKVQCVEMGENNLCNERIRGEMAYQLIKSGQH